VDINDVDAVKEVLKYHVVAGVGAKSTDLKASQEIPTVEGDTIEVLRNFYGVTVNDAKVVVPDVISSNGVVHVIDKVLIPPTAATSPTIVENAVATPALSTLVAVLTDPRYADILGVLSGNGPFTVFAPTNDAFAAAGVDINDVDAVKEVLKYHVVAGVGAKSTDLKASQEIPTVEGDTIEVLRNFYGVTVNDAKVVVPDVISSNGVVHVIDKVLIPPTATSSSSGVDLSRCPNIDTASSVSTARRSAAITVIDEAIQEGVPIFNNGNHYQTAVIYLEAAQELARDFADLVSDLHLQDLVNALKASSYTDMAWDLRRALDSMREEWNSSASAASSNLSTFSTQNYRIGGKDLQTQCILADPSLWFTVDDRVMGGRSVSTYGATKEGYGVFSGTMVKQGGGFASQETREIPAEWDDTKTKLTVTVQGDGQEYAIYAQVGQGWRSATWQAALQTKPNFEPTVVEIPFSSFTPTFMGQRLTNQFAGAFSPSLIDAWGFRLSFLSAQGGNNTSFKDGPFELIIHSVEAS